VDTRTGRTILTALVDGETDPERLAALVTTRVQATRAELVDALRGTVTEYHRFELRLHLEFMGQLERAVAEVEERITRALPSFRVVAQRLTTIPAISGDRRRIGARSCDHAGGRSASPHLKEGLLDGKAGRS
jgi:hypothetical protein